MCKIFSSTWYLISCRRNRDSIKECWISLRVDAEVPSLLWEQPWGYKEESEDRDQKLQLKNIFFTWGQWQCRVKHMKYHHRDGKELSRITDKLMRGQRFLQSLFLTPVAVLEVPRSSQLPGWSLLQRMTLRVYLKKFSWPK